MQREPFLLKLVLDHLPSLFSRVRVFVLTAKRDDPVIHQCASLWRRRRTVFRRFSSAMSTFCLCDVFISYKPGNLSFVRYDYKSRCAIEAELREKKQQKKESNGEAAFQGRGATIRKRY